MLSRWQSTIVDERGNVQPLANLTVRLESDQSLAKMWASPGTSQPLPDGMVQADGNGYAFFYARGGLYRITSVALGIDWRHVPLGELAHMDVADLGFGTAATRDVGTGANTVAAGDDSRITGAAQKSANLSDLTNASTARNNLGLGTAAIADVVGTVAGGAIVERGNNANGIWVKFAGGLQICTAVFQFTTTSQDFGALHVSNADLVWTFPTSFSSRPRVSHNVAAYTGRFTVSATTGYGPNSHPFRIASTSPFNNISITVEITAIGFWD